MRKWRGARVGILGGDARELEVIRCFLEEGCEVRTYGVVSTREYDELAAATPYEAVYDADVIVAPVPGASLDDSLYAPAAPEPIYVNAELFQAAKRGAFYFAGRATPTMMKAGEPYGIRFFALGDDDYLQVLHAIPTAEGAIAITVQQTEHTIHNATALVVGYGRIGTLLARNLRGLGAKVTVAARRPEVRVRAFADGYPVCDTTPTALSEVLPGCDLIYTTAPAPLLPRGVLQHARRGALVMDLASPPGGMDHEAGRELGLNVVWARAQAGTAPKHSGHAQFLVMQRILDEHF